MFVQSILALAFAGLTALLSPPVGAGGSAQNGYETLQGFDTVLVNQINAIIGTQNLPTAMGLPIEPGLYVTIAPERTLIFDKVAATIKGSSYADPTPAAECKSGCARTIFDAFHFNWKALADEGAAVGVDIPSRVLFAADRSVSAKVLVETAYAAAETRPGALPSLYLLLNGGQAGVRSRPFSLLPPQGLAIPRNQRVLGLRIRVHGGGRFTVTAAASSFGRTLELDAAKLVPTLVDIKKNYPSKETMIIEAGDGATVDDIVRLMDGAKKQFPRIVLTAGQPVRISG